MKLWIRIVIQSLVLGAFCGAPSFAQSEDGRRVYHGVAPSALDDAELTFAENGYALPARSFPCVSCHGEFGSGRPERGTVPPDLSRAALTKPYEMEAERGRIRGPYDLTSFKRAVRLGIDSSGNKLDETMPRYDLSDEVLTELWDYLSVVRTSADPGISETDLKILFVTGEKIGTEKIERLLAARVSQINSGGGIHGRVLDFVVTQSLEDDELAQDAFLILSLVPVSEAQRSQRPVIQIKSNHLNGPANVFSLVSGAQEQAAALRLFAAREFMAELHLGDSCQDTPESFVLFVMEAPCANAFSSEATLFFTQTAFDSLEPGLRHEIQSKTYLALGADAGRLSRQGKAAFSRFASVHKIPMDEDVFDLANAYTLATLSIDILMRSGRKLSTSEFVAQLEQVSSYIGGVTPPLSFGPNRRVGNTGSLVIALGPSANEIASSSEWIALPTQ